MLLTILSAVFGVMFNMIRVGSCNPALDTVDSLSKCSLVFLQEQLAVAQAESQQDSEKAAAMERRLQDAQSDMQQARDQAQQDSEKAAAMERRLQDAESDVQQARDQVQQLQQEAQQAQQQAQQLQRELEHVRQR